MNRKWDWFGFEIIGWGIFQLFLFIILFIIGVNGCEFQESQLVKEQAVTFENEIAYRQRKEIELENKLKKANETIAKLEKQLECQKELKD